jgi:hypothetical protein
MRPLTILAVLYTAASVAAVLWAQAWRTKGAAIAFMGMGASDALALLNVAGVLLVWAAIRARR